MNIKQKFKPTYMYDKVEDISVEFLKKENVHGIILDVDNTIVPRNKIVDNSVNIWLKKLSKSGINICILSNAFSIDRIKKLMNEYNIYGLANARKPSQKGFVMAQNLLDVPKENIVIIGDQLFTDVLGANRFNIRSILVKPRDKSEWIFTKIKRPFENLFLKKYRGEK